MDSKACEFYLGTAVVPLRALRYMESETYGDNCTGCCVDDIYHNLPTLIRAPDLETLLDKSGTARNELYRVSDYPKLACPESMVMHCLHGKFRLESARDNEHDPSEWWAVDFYSAEMPLGASVHIRQVYRNHGPLCDGEIYLRVRYHQRADALEDAAAWLSKLSKSKQKNIAQLSRNQRLMRSLDSLEPFRGLWQDFHISCFPPILSWRCYEEIESYLSYMITTWNTLTQGNASWCDLLTVQNLQALAPTWSSIDREKIETLHSSHKIFPRVHETSRESILHGVLNLPEFVPSFNTFFKHTKLIGTSMVALRQLVLPMKAQLTIRTAFHDCCKSVDTQDSSCIIQHSNTEEHRISTDPRRAVDLAYVQLFLSCLRDKTSVPARVRGTTTDSSGWLVRLAHAADHLGFESDVILRLKHRNPDMCDIREHMKRERPEALYSVSPSAFDQESQLRHARQAIYKPRLQSMRQSMTGEHPASDRSTVNYHYLYLPFISHALAAKSIGPSLTSFGKLVLALSVFFGSLRSDIPVARNDSFDSRVRGRADSPHHSNSDVDHQNADAQTTQTSRGMPQHKSSTSVVFTFISLEEDPVFSPIIQCEGSTLAIAETLEKIDSHGFKTLLVAPGSDDSFLKRPLNMIKSDPQVLAHLGRYESRPRIFFCTSTQPYLGKRLIDFSYLRNRLEDTRTL